MKTETKRRLLMAGAMLIGIPAALCAVAIGLLWWGLCYGEDPLQAGIEKDGVSAFRATQRMGDQRVYLYVDNSNPHEVAVDLNLEVFDQRTRKSGVKQIHTVLGPRSGRRIYPDGEVPYGQPVSLSVTDTMQK